MEYPVHSLPSIVTLLPYTRKGSLGKEQTYKAFCQVRAE